MELKSILEAILFSAQKPLSLKELRDVFAGAVEHAEGNEAARGLKKVKEEQLTTALEELARDHEAANRSYRLACVAGSWQFVTQPDYGPWLKSLVGHRARPPRLSQPGLETLAIIAYRQPITRSEIEQVRGVTVDGVMQTLLERGLVEQVGRAEVVGRPMTYGTTALFMEYFGLRSLEDLPAADELRRVPIQKPESLVTADPGLATVPPEQLTLAAAEGEPKDKDVKTEPVAEIPGECDAKSAAAGTHPMNIPKHRHSIDKLDAQIVKLLNDRTRHVLAIGEIKRKAGEEIYAPHRERAVLHRLCRQNQGPITNESLHAIYREIMSSALSLEKSMKIAYLGPEATFTHQAAIRRFGSSLRYSPQKTITDVFTEVSKGRAEYGVVPVENSTEGVVTHTLDMFVDSELKIVAQIVLPVQHCLLSNCPRTKIRKLFAHPQSLGQCRAWVQNNLPHVEIIETSSNARSADLAAGQRRTAAIAGILAAEKYGLEVIEYDIQDNAANATRFLVLGRQCSPPTGHDRTSLMVSVTDKVGALHNAIAAFRRFRINMTKIESRPSKRKAWEYFFFIDCDGHIEDSKVDKAVRHLGDHCNFVKVLGSYPNSE